MSKKILVQGTVVKNLPGRQFLVRIDGTGHIAQCHSSGKLTTNHIKIMEGDRVDVQLSEYDLKKGIIVYRGQRKGLVMKL